MAQNQRKKIQTSGLQTLVSDEETLDLQVRMIRAMAFVPIADLDAVWHDLVGVIDDRLEPLVTYVDTFYMGATVGGRRRQPRFPPSLWNMFVRTRDGAARTNNSIEAYHRSLNTHFGVDHPTMWVALSKLQQYQQKVDCDYEDLIANRHPQTTRPKIKWLKAEERKQKCVQDYTLHQNKLDYLRGVAHNLSI
jgi:hypothetical protein